MLSQNVSFRCVRASRSPSLSRRKSALFFSRVLACPGRCLQEDTSACHQRGRPYPSSLHGCSPRDCKRIARGDRSTRYHPIRSARRGGRPGPAPPRRRTRPQPLKWAPPPIETTRQKTRQQTRDLHIVALSKD